MLTEPSKEDPYQPYKQPEERGIRYLNLFIVLFIDYSFDLFIWLFAHLLLLFFIF